MLPDYPRIKDPIQRKVQKIMRQRTDAKSFLPMKNVTILHEGSRTKLIRSDGSVDDTPMKRSHAKFEIKEHEAINGQQGDMLKKHLLAADDLVSQMNVHFLKTLDDAVESVGNVVKSPSGLTPESLLEMLGKVQIEFDDNNEPEWPTLIIHPSNNDVLISTLTAIHEDPEYQPKFMKLINRKREEYRARESNRRLVD